MPFTRPPPVVPPSNSRSWAAASAGLAARVNRRTAIESALHAAGPWIVVGGVLCIAARALGAETAVLASFAAAGFSVGALRGALRARRTPQVSPGDAAWAMDRLARLGECGLAAATLPTGSVPEPLMAPPQPGLRPPGGLTLAIAGALLVALAFLAPDSVSVGEMSDDPTPSLGAGSGAGGEGGSPAAARGDRDSSAPTDAAAVEPSDPAAAHEDPALSRVRKALNLAPGAPLDPHGLLERLDDPATRARLAAALAEHPVGTLLRDGENGADSAVTALLDQQRREADQMERVRRQAVEQRLGAGTEPVPPNRLSLVVRYLQRLPH